MGKETCTYRTIAHSSEYEFREKGSRFIGVVLPVSDLDEIRKEIAVLRRDHSGANHVCYAYRLGFSSHVKEYCTDDGEPAYSAGKPILKQLIKEDVTQILAVVIRYFGGVKLGVGGLIKAYRQGAAKALSTAEIIEKERSILLEIEAEYDAMYKVFELLKNKNIEAQTQQKEKCYFRCSAPLSLQSELEGLLGTMDGVSWKIEIEDTL